MAEEDVLFGKNRHLFGGIEPSNMIFFKATPTRLLRGGAPAVVLNIKLPSDTTVDGQTICTVAGAIIRKSTTGYPETEFEGELVIDAKENTEFTDTDVETDVTYYYSAFPYSDQEVYNRGLNSVNIDNAMIDQNTPSYVYGYDLDMNDSNPATRVTYPVDVDNYEFASAYMDFTKGEFNYGDWASEPGVGFIPSPCNIKSANLANKVYLDPNDYCPSKSGGTSDYYMMEWPKIYTKRWEENGVYHFRCSDVKMDEDYDCWSNYDTNNNEIDHFYTSIYPATYDRWLYVAPITDHTTGLTAEEFLAKKVTVSSDRSAWSFDQLCDRFLIQDLLVLMGKSTDTQSIYGTGILVSENNKKNGTMDTKGLFWGTNNGTVGVKVFGMEHWWGNTARYLPGLVDGLFGGSRHYYRYKITRGTHDGSTATDYTLGDGYIGYDSLSSGNMNVAGTRLRGYISDMMTFDWGRICDIEVNTSTVAPYNGSATTYECDYIDFGYTYSTTYCGTTGVFTTNINQLGAFGYSGWNMDGAGSSYIGVSLSYKPTKA